MARYIDVVDLLWMYEYESDKYAEFEELVADVPTADVVEVVRCKDCVNCTHLVYEYDRTEEWWCGAKEVLPDGFCNYGERREDAEIH